MLEERLVQLEQKLVSTGAEIPPPIHSPSPPLLEENTTRPKVDKEDDDFPPIEIVNHLVELFFQYVNSVFPLVHRGRLRQSIEDGTVSKPLLWALMAIAARFSDHPNIKADPPYWAGERFATKATLSINAFLLEPTIPNLQFWGIMSCLEYGRASGSKAWTYGGIAVRICQELGLNKESVLVSPITLPDGSIDYVAMALRRRIFWSCLCIDKFASTSTNRPQGFELGDYDATYPTRAESLLLLDPLQSITVDRRTLPHNSDPLMDVIPHYIGVLERFGEVAKYMSRAKTDTTSAVTWPPIGEFSQLEQSMLAWKSNLPESYQFSLERVQSYRENASQNYLNFWLCGHAMYCTGMLALHRGSLAYSDLSATDLTQDIYERIQHSIRSCQAQVETATQVFQSLKDTCGCNVLPYMGYCAYIFSTVLMTSAFSSDPAAYAKSSMGLAVLFDSIKILSPYWPMSERLALTTRDMLSAHSRLYDVQEHQDAANHMSIRPSKSSVSQSPDTYHATSPHAYPSSYIPRNSSHPTLHTSPSSQPVLQGINNQTDFNSCEFLYDSALFGQIIFDSSHIQRPTHAYYQPNSSTENSMMNVYPSYTPQKPMMPPNWNP
ncbi:fungal-specific transcription factor domain-containing protein [Blakeslea trispora]|nr:fungal-specific transcription factor domain-containing protein [Blakeslea trispora]